MISSDLPGPRTQKGSEIRDFSQGVWEDAYEDGKAKAITGSGLENAKRADWSVTSSSAECLAQNLQLVGATSAGTLLDKLPSFVDDSYL